jgi:diguanylate cyclase (GGDEF)-like protein
MTYYKAPIEYQEGRRVLFDSSYRAIPFNMVLAGFISLSLYFNKAPLEIVACWLAIILVINTVRMAHCRYVVSKGLMGDDFNFHLRVFVFLTALAGLAWSCIYFASIPYVNELQRYLILLVCGGLISGSAATLAIYFPSFLAFMLTTFLPVVVYNYYLWRFDSLVFAGMLTFFLVAISVIAKSHQILFKKLFFLTEQNKNLKEQFEILSITDQLTRLYNRRYFMKIIQSEYNRAKRNKQSFALVSLDVDNFKLINDNLGHPFGDNFLVYIASYLKSYLQRANDIIFRVGGDEFSVLLLNTTEEITRQIFDKIKAEFLIQPKFDYNPQDVVHQKVLEQVSLSFGVAFVDKDAYMNIGQIIEQADWDLYQSKHEAKNRIGRTKR